MKRWRGRDITYRDMRTRVEESTIPEPNSGCWLWIEGWNTSGYGRTQLNGAHRYSWVAHNMRPIPPGMWVLHKCDTPACVNPDHLYVGTRDENTRDRVVRNRGTTLANGARFATRYTDEQIADVRMLHSSGWTQQAIASKHGMCRSYVHYLVHHRSRHCQIGVKQ